jgi:Ca-activated chloride channel family protein
MRSYFFDLTGYIFIEPNYLYLLLLLPFVVWVLYLLEKRHSFGVKYTNTENKQLNLFSSFVWVFRKFLFLTKIGLYVLLVLVLAQPFKNSSENIKEQERGVDLIFVLDVSLSMMAMDLKPDRLTSAKNVISNFVRGRNGDRIGLVVYSGEAYSACHKTSDYELLISKLNEVNGDQLIQGTAVGVGLGTGVAQLHGDTTVSKAIILLTDGSNNTGDVSPIDAAELAEHENIRVYTIGVGTNGLAPIPDPTPYGVGYYYSQVEIDEEILQAISNKTGGKYFRATDSESLQNIVLEIDKIEKKIHQKNNPVVPVSATPQPFLKLILLLISFILISDIFLFVNNE